jgi:acetate kinase
VEVVPVSILVFNAGSSTLKFSLFGGSTLQRTVDGIVEGTPVEKGAGDDRLGSTLRVVRDGGIERTAPVAGRPAEAVSEILAEIAEELSSDPVTAVGHRVVHGGRALTKSVAIDLRVLEEIYRLSDLAPLHNPPALASITAAQKALAGVPHVAVFDTAFFSSLPPSRHVYALPYEWYAEVGIRRYGFHGISHEYCAGRTVEILGRSPEGLRIVTCHLGNGCSATATVGGRAVSTTMGFTPLEGLVMGTRAGSVDPGILLYAMERMGLSAGELGEILQRRSGLFGLSGVSSDFRTVQEAARNGHERARLALSVYADAVRSAIGSLAASAGGVNALVFTAGVGEHASALREEICRGLSFLGIVLDPERNRTRTPDADVAADDSPGRILVLHTREDLFIAGETRRVSETVR